MNADELWDKMISAGRGLAGGIWEQMETVAIPELKKIADQIADLADPNSPWSMEESKILFRMQVRSAVSIIVALTSLIMSAVEKAINAILDAVRDFVNGKLPFPLL